MYGTAVITPETITSYARDAAGRVLSTRQDTGAMTTQESTEYDLLGRMTSSTDVLGRVTTYAYSGDGLTATQTAPFRGYIHHAQRAGRNGDGRIRHGAAARHLRHRPGQRRCADLHESRLRGNGNRAAAQHRQRSRGNPAHGHPQHRRRSHLHEAHLQRQRAAWSRNRRTRATRPRRWPRPCGNTTPSATEQKKTWKLADPATVSNSRITAWSYGTEQSEDGVYQVVTATRNNGRERPATKRRKRFFLPSRPRWKAKSFPSTPGETLPNNGANTARAPSGRRKAASPLPMS